MELAWRITSTIPRVESRRVFTDASVDTMQAGIAAVTPDGDGVVGFADTPVLKGAGAAGAEIMAAVVAITMFSSTTRRLVVTTDSQITMGITSPSTAAVLRPLRSRMLDALRKAAAAGCEVVFEWVRGHSGTEGNERADAMAREARRCRASGAAVSSALAAATTCV